MLFRFMSKFDNMKHTSNNIADNLKDVTKESKAFKHINIFASCFHINA